MSKTSLSELTNNIGHLSHIEKGEKEFQVIKL